MRVVQTRASQAEARLDYVGLLDLLSPLVPGIWDNLAPPRRTALEAALRLSDSSSLDAMAVDAACLDVLTAVASRDPLLVIVDDAQWFDVPSLEALQFAARRVNGARVGVLFAARVGTACAVAQAGFEGLALAGLTHAEAITLLRRLARSPLHGSVASAIVTETAGNPLALEEAVRRLSPDQLSRAAPLPHPLPIPSAIQQAYDEHHAILPARSRAALVVAAAAGGAPAHVLADALAELNLAVGDLEVAERAGAGAGGSADIAHPLVRAAVLHACGAGTCRRSHRALATAWTRVGDSVRPSWHLAQAADGSDPELSRLLAEAAHAARARGAVSASADMFQRAAETTGDGAVGAALSFEGAFDLVRAGRAPEALGRVDDLLARAPSPAARGDLDLLRGQVLWTDGRLGEAATVLLDAATRGERRDPSSAVTMLCMAALSLAGGGDVNGCLRSARRAAALVRSVGEPQRAMVQLGLAWARFLSGRAAGRRVLLRAMQLANEHESFARTALAPSFGQVACWMEEYDTASDDLGLAVAHARERGAIGELCAALTAMSEYERRTGDWSAARAHGAEAFELSAVTGSHAGHAAVELGLLDVMTGNIESAYKRLARGLLIGERTGTSFLAMRSHAALGLLELGGGELRGALDHLEQTRRLARRSGLGEPNVVQWAPDLVETQIRLGESAAAERTLARFEHQAARTGGRWARAAARRCRGLLVAGGEVDAVFAEAERLARAVPAPFEYARLELCWGERLRRDGRRVEGRKRLGKALEGFESLGAGPWAHRAAREIRGSGARAHRGPTARSTELTGQETEVVRLVAEGLTNKQVAAHLFLSPKTVEFHLGHAFRKLDVRTRTQLARVVRAPSLR